ncbi:hypothetical protein [Streptomyces sp. NPDC091268]|uniref:hypothetical protein n=1 Tax=Streptomyces sp. NPDC091268 TaxID=3365979 RepID=UPI003804D1F0
MELEKPPPEQVPQGEGCLVGVVRIPVKIVAVLIVLPVRVVWDLLVAAARRLHRHVLGPVGRALSWFHDRALRPVLRGLGRVAAFLLRLVFVWPWVGLWRYVLAPVGRAAAWVGGALATYFLRPLGAALVWLGRALFVWPWVALWRYALVPGGGLLLAYVLRPVAAGTAWLARAFHRYLLAPVGAALLWSARGLGALAGLIGRALFVWPWVGLWRYLVVPVAGGLYRYLLAPLGRGVYAYLLAPLGRLLVGAWHLAGRITRALGRGLLLLWRGLVARPCAWVYRQVATPVGHLVREVWRTGRAAVREARAEVRRVLFGGPPREPARSRARTLGSTTAAGNAPAPEISPHQR